MAQDKSYNPADDHVFNRLLKERIIWLGSEVRDDNANLICSQMLLLSAGTRRRTSTSTSTLPAARSPRAWPSTTPCS